MPEFKKKTVARKPKAKRPALRVIRTSPSSSGAPERVRWSKVVTAQTRIADGYYDRDEVREQLLSQVLNELLHH